MDLKTWHVINILWTFDKIYISMLNNIKQDCHLSLKEKFVAQLFCIMLRTTIYRIISRSQILYI